MVGDCWSYFSVPAAAAEILGARSLRNLYAVNQQSTDRLPCPSAGTLRRLLPAYGDAAHVLADIAEVCALLAHPSCTPCSPLMHTKLPLTQPPYTSKTPVTQP